MYLQLFLTFGSDLEVFILLLFYRPTGIYTVVERTQVHTLQWIWYGFGMGWRVSDLAFFVTLFFMCFCSVSMGETFLH